MSRSCSLGAASRIVIAHLDESEFYVQPSLTEAFGRSVVEGLSRGCICIGNRVGGITELVEEIFLVAPKKPQEIFDRIMLFINMGHEEKRNAVKRSFEHSKEYTADKMDEKRDSYYKEVLRKVEGETSGKYTK